MDYEKLGLKMGLEIHQQLNSQHKLFCPCKTELVDDDFDELVQRKLRPTQSELGEIDRAALQESLLIHTDAFRMHFQNIFTAF